MHTVHLPSEDKGFYAAAVGILFDTKFYDTSVSVKQVDIINKFFDSLRFD